MQKLIACTPKSLPHTRLEEAARHASEQNPANAPPLALSQLSGFKPTKEFIAAMTTKYWGAQGVKLTVSFMDTTSAALRTRILSHMNAWNRDANVSFVETQQKGQVRIAFTKGDGYWSYVGTDIGLIPSNEPTMNLDSFTMNTPDSEFHRVVRHEAGHTLGFIHEHMRRALVAKIDEEKAISFFMATQGWTKEEVRAQVLTPIEESSLRATTPDPNSIMCYQISGELTVDGEPIPGGVDIDELDHALCAKLYPTPSHEATLTRTTTTQHGGTLLFLPETDPAYIAAVIAAATR